MTIHDVRVISRPRTGNAVSDDLVGRIDMDLLKADLPFGDYDFYVCGPSPFMQTVYNGLRKLNIADDRIHAEAFGRSGLKRDKSVSPASIATKPAAAVPTRVIFSQSAKEARWKPGDGLFRT